MMKNEKLDRLNAKVSAYLTLALKEFYGQNFGVRIISIETTKNELNPPGDELLFKIKTQITLDNKKEGD